MKKVFGSIILFYLRILSKIRLKRVKPIVVGLTGSVGKTSLRDAIALVLSAKYRVKKTEKANSESGIPLDILDLHMRTYSLFDWIRVCFIAPFRAFFGKDEHEVYVVEMGVDSPNPPKNMEYLLKVVKPFVGVILNVSAVHSENYDPLVSEEIKGKRRTTEISRLIASEKGKLIEALPKDGFSIVNNDNEYVQEVSTKTRAQKVTFGKKRGSDIKIGTVKQLKEEFRVNLTIDGKKYTVKNKKAYFSDGYSYNFAAAIAVGKVLGVKVPQAVKKLSKYELPPGRMNIFFGKNGSLLIDSSYNASRLSMIEAFDLVKKVSKGNKEKVILALGDMREMGKESKIEHEEVAIEAFKVADRIVLVGPMMKEFFLPKIIKLGFKKNKISHFDNSRDAGEYIENNLLKKGDTVLAKGSQNTIFMENIIEQLLKYDEDIDKLCRRAKYWGKIRSQY